MRHKPRRAALLEGAAFRSFYDEAMPRIYGYFLHRCGGSRFTAEELTQETFLAVVAELKRGAEVDSPIPWIFGIARHKLLDHYRRQERDARRVVSAREAGDPVAASVEDDVRQQALSALASVPASQRAALVLRHLDGLSVPEVAEALGRSVEATESLLARGRRHFRRAYTGADDA
jgi:RNA polymerase sigma-70 factor (ECF subfamily)